MSTLRIAFVYPQLKRLTGAQRLILQLATTVADLGHQVVLVTHHLAPACRAVLSPTVGVIETGRCVDWTGRHVIDSAAEYAASLGLVERVPLGVDATIFFGPPSLPALALARRRGRARLINFCYEPPRFAYADRTLIAARFGPAAPLARAAFHLYRPLDRRLIAQADLIAANGRFGADEIQRVYGRPAIVIDHGVALPQASASAVEAIGMRLGIGDAPVVLSVNHLHPRKRLDLFLRTVAVVRQRAPSAVGVVAGDGGDRPRLELIAAELGLGDGVRFPGFVDEADLPALYQRASVYLHTGRQETFGLSVLEAAASGVPVVAVDEGGPRDILDEGRLGRLCPPTADALAAAVLGLLADPAAARVMGAQAAASVAARFQWRRGAETLVAAVRGLMAGRDEAAIVAATTARRA